MSSFLSIVLYGALILGVLVFVHELGHFLMAKWLGVRVLSFSIGMGPRVLGFTRGGTDYRLSLLPLGGYVRMAGDTTEGEERTGAPDEFLEKPWWVRALISVAGPAANLVFAFFLYLVLFADGVSTTDFAARVDSVRPGTVAEQVGLRKGDLLVSWDGEKAGTFLHLQTALERTLEEKDATAPIPLGVERAGATTALMVPRADALKIADGIVWGTDPIIGKVLIGLPAYSAGLRDGDRVTAVDGKPVAIWNELATHLKARPNEFVSITALRDGREFTVRLRTTPEGYVGIAPPERLTFHQSIPLEKVVPYAFNATIQTCGQIYAGLYSVFSKPDRLAESVAGPIAIAQVAEQTASGGIEQLMNFAAFISLALMAMNLLPIPILDGGHIMFALVEAVRRRPLSERTQMVVQRAGLFLLVTLVVFSFYNDLNRVTQRKRAEAEVSRSLSEPKPADSTPAPGTP
ncbi:MAG TPA: RIP metalloprotease RseP [Candidatus Eisenbacteria bacterium]|nr:RIP metalloprotease RseP [Candidatus Eisenbacteria bacterium]